MRASDVYELSVVPPSAERRAWRRISQVLAILTTISPTPVGGERLLIIDTRSGEVVGEHRQRFADEFYDMRIRSDLSLLSADEFRAQWVER